MAKMSLKEKTISDYSAYGGDGWIPRSQGMSQDIGKIWAPCGISNEWASLKSVVLHRPGKELASIKNPNAMQMLGTIDLKCIQEQHDELAHAYRSAGIKVHYINPAGLPPPNQIFVADQFFSTPEGIILSRPASVIRMPHSSWAPANSG